MFPRATLLLLLSLAACTSEVQEKPDARPDDGPKPEVVIATSRGEMVVRLEPVEMPITTANFLAYVDAGWYEGTLIHRVVNNFVIQGGGYTTGLVEKPSDPPITLETSDLVPHVAGAISMARTNDPNSATTQWFIVETPQRQLDGAYAAFGVVIEGLDVLADISSVSTATVGDLDDVPIAEVTVTSMTRR